MLPHAMEMGLHAVLLVGTGEVRGELRAELTPGVDGPRGKVHEPSLGWPGQGYVEVTCHNSVVNPRSRDGGDVDLQEFLRVGGPVVLFRQVGAKLGWPSDHSEVVCECYAAHPSHWGLSVSTRPWCSRVELGVEVPALDVEPALTRPLHGDAGVLSRAPAVEFCSQILGLRTPHCWRVHRAGCGAALTATLP